MPRALTVLALASVTALACATPVDDEVKRFMTFFMTPGVSLAVVKDGKLVYAKGYGVANVEDGAKVRPDTVFRIASVSKQFLAAGIMVLEQDGKLSVDDKLTKYFAGTPPEWSEITLRHLLNHTSGLQRETPGYEPFGDAPLLDQIKKGFSTKLEFPTGTKFQYCNYGYFMLAQIIEQVSGQPWSEFMRNRVFLPAGMTATDVTNEDLVLPNRARAYAHDNGVLVNMPPWTAVRPSGAFMSTVLDLAKWDALLWTNKVLSDASKAKMWAQTVLPSGEQTGYGFGWFFEEDRGHRVIRHDGGLVGFATNFSRYVDDKVTVIVFANELETRAETLCRMVAAQYIPGLKRSPDKTIPDKEPEKTALLARYFKSRLAEKPDTSIMTEDFVKRVNWATGRARFRGFGDLVSLTPLDPADLEPPFTHRYLAKFKNITLYASAVYKDGKIESAGASLE